MKIRLLFFTCLFTCLHGLAQDVVQEMKKVNSKKTKALDTLGWKKTGLFALNINQAALSDWSTGGESFQIGINALLNYTIHHKFGKYSMDVYSDIELGFFEAASFGKFRKTNDRCDITVEFEHTMGKKTYYGFLINFNSQFLPGHNYKLPGEPKVSGFLSPGKLIFSPGVDYKDQSKEFYFSIFLSPFTARWVTKMDRSFLNTNKFGVDSSLRVYTELGPYLSVHLNERISPTINYIGRLDLYSNYKRDLQNVDVLFNNLITINISKIFAANILFDVIYDHDIKAKAQILETFGIGLKLKL